MAKLTNATHQLNVIMRNQLAESPAREPLYKTFGPLQLPAGIGINARFIDLNVLITTGAILAKDDFSSVGGIETIDKPGRIKAKVLDSGVIRFPKLEALEILQGPSMPAAIKFRETIANGMAALDQKIVDWVTAGPTIGTATDYDPDWKAPLVLKAATGTIADPQDMSTVPGTSTNLGAVNFHGAGKTVANLSATFGLQTVAFANKDDDFSGRSLILDDARFTAVVHPGFGRLLRSYKDWTAASVEASRTYAEDLNLMGIDLLPSIQCSWTGAVDATTNVIIIPNIKDEIFMAFMPGGQPQAEPLKETENSYYTRIWAKVACAAKRHTFDAGTTVEKAVAHFTCTPIGA